MRRSIVRKGCLGCGAVAGGALAIALLLWLFAPGLLERAVDWALYVEPPTVQVSPNGSRQVKEAITSLYGTVDGDRPVERVELDEGAINGLLTANSGGAVRDARADLVDNGMTLYAAIDLADAADGEYADLLADVPSFLRERRVSVRVELEGITTAGDRLNFESMDVKVGRIWLPFSGAWAVPILQRMAERQLGTRLPETGLPLPPGSTATIAKDRLVVELGSARRR